MRRRRPPCPRVPTYPRRSTPRRTGAQRANPTPASVPAQARLARLREAPPGAPSHRRRHRMPEAAVEVDGLVKRYGATTAVNGVTFVAPTGSMLALLGPNGAGKTTTVEICEGFRRADAGTCLLYTSDAADQEDSVDLGGRRIIKKKKKNIT